MSWKLSQWDKLAKDLINHILFVGKIPHLFLYQLL